MSLSRLSTTACSLSLSRFCTVPDFVQDKNRDFTRADCVEARPEDDRYNMSGGIQAVSYCAQPAHTHTRHPRRWFITGKPLRRWRTGSELTSGRGSSARRAMTWHEPDAMSVYRSRMSAAATASHRPLDVYANASSTASHACPIAASSPAWTCPTRWLLVAYHHRQ